MSEPGKPEYHCKKCDAIVQPTDEKCPNGHDLSIVGKAIKLTLTEGLTLSDSVNLASRFVINKIEDMVKDLEPGPKTTEINAELDYAKDILKALENHNREMKEEFERDREPIPLPKRIVNSILDDIPVTIFWFLVSTGLILLSLLF